MSSSCSAQQICLSSPILTIAVLNSYNERRGEKGIQFFFGTCGFTDHCWYFQVIISNYKSSGRKRKGLRVEISPQKGLAGKTQDTSCYTGHLHLTMLPQRAACLQGPSEHVLLGKLVFPTVVFLSISASCPSRRQPLMLRGKVKGKHAQLSRLKGVNAKGTLENPAGMRQ